jgi:hypothetical protein
MSTIGGPGGIGGPKGPGGSGGSPAVEDGGDVPDVGGVGEVGDVANVGDVASEVAVAGPQAARATELDALAAEVAAGRLTPHEALDRLVEAAAGPGLDATERAELRELLRDLVANDPYLGALVGRI